MFRRINILFIYGVIGIGLAWQIAGFLPFASSIGTAGALYSYSPPQLVTCGQDLGDLFLSTPGQADTFLINLRAGDLFRIQMTFQEDGPNEQLAFYDPRGNLLTTSVQNGSGAAILQWPIDELGVYMIVAAEAGGTATGFYGISFQNDNRPGCARIVNCGEEANSFFPLAGIEAFSLQANQNDTLRIQLQFLDDNKNPSIQLFDPTGNLLVEINGPAGELVVLTYDNLPQSGNYTILVTEATGQEGGFFGISFQLLEESCALAVDCQTDGEGEMASVAGMEAFSLAATAGDTLLVQLRYETEEIVPTLYLYQPDGSLLDSLIGTANELLVFSFEGLPIDGAYLLLASSDSKVTPGNFGISFQLLTPSNCTTSFLDNGCEDSEFVSIKGLAEMQAYTFEGTAGEFVAFQIAPSTGDFSGHLRVYDPQGKLMQESSGAAGELTQIAPFALPETGNYILIVDEVEGNNTGIHALTGQRLSTTGDIDQELSICPGESIFVGGAEQTEPGIYYDLQANDNACDEIIVTSLVPRDLVNINVVEAICYGDTLSLRGNNYIETGIYDILIPNPTGCDTLIKVDLLLIEPVESVINDTICAGEIYTLGRQGYGQSGTYSDTLCDTIIALNLTVLPVIETIIDTTICQGSYIEVSTFRYLETGSYSNLLETTRGCDSLVRVELTVVPIETPIDTTICTGQWMEVNNVRYFDTGYYPIMLETTGGCDSLVSLNLTVIPLLETQIDTTICSGQWIEVGTFKYFESGPYSNLLETSTGCDSLVRLNLTVLPPPTTIIDTTICEGESVRVNNIRYSETGNYPIFVDLGNNCDSIVDLTLTVLDSVVNDITVTLCEGANFSIGNTAYSTTGSYSQTLTGSNGCDSTVNLNLIISNTHFTNLDVDICEGEAYRVGTSNYTESGDYTINLLNQQNCDSIVRLNLTVIPTVSNAINTSICEGEVFNVGTSAYTLAGAYIDTLVSSLGCDSIVSLSLSVHPLPSFELSGDTSLCSGETTQLIPSNSYPSYAWSTGAITANLPVQAAATYTLTVTDDNGCSNSLSRTVQISQLAADITPSPFPNGFNISCPDETDGQLTGIAFNGVSPYVWSWNTSGNVAQLSGLGPGFYEATVTDAFGCETVVNYDLLAPPDFELSIGITPPICPGEGGLVDIMVDGQTGPYTFEIGAIQQSIGLFEDVTAGTRSLSVTDANGCRQETTIEIPQAAFLITQSFEQASISEGDSIQLEISANFPIDKIRWEPARWLSCTDCPNPVARPAATTIYRAIVFSENGCDLSANFRLDVGPFDGFFIPNSFSPNGDGVNDHYFFHADERVGVIEEVMIFDRWGKLLFQRSDMAPNSADLGWDGRDQNQPVQVGVYTYYASIKLYNGQVKIYKGDLTLLR